MIVKDVFIIKKRGPVACVTVVVETPHAGASLRRTSDGTMWPIRGIERFCMYLGRPMLGAGEKVGILLPDGTDVKAGDEVEVV